MACFRSLSENVRSIRPCEDGLEPPGSYLIFGLAAGQVDVRPHFDALVCSSQLNDNVGVNGGEDHPAGK
jgi:hypothetical protein